MEIEIEKVSRAQASALMKRAQLVDPARMSTPDEIANNGECFSLTCGQDSGVFVVKKKGAQLWISGAAALATRGLAKVGMQAMDAIAEQSNCQTIGFQTSRAGLVRLAKKQGYKIAGFILEKRI